MKLIPFLKPYSMGYYNQTLRGKLRIEIIISNKNPVFRNKWNAFVYFPLKKLKFTLCFSLW